MKVGANNCIPSIPCIFLHFVSFVVVICAVLFFFGCLTQNFCIPTARSSKLVYNHRLRAEKANADKCTVISYIIITGLSQYVNIRVRGFHLV